MSEQLISRRGAFSLLGLTAALGFALPTTMLTESDAEAQVQPTTPAPAPLAPAPSAQPMSGMQHDQEQQTGGKKRRQARAIPVARSVVRRGTTPARGVVRRGTPVARSVVRRGEKPISFT